MTKMPGVLVVAALAVVTVTAAAPPNRMVTIVVNEAARRVDITIGGTPFTSYIWPERVKKPVLDPIRSAKGTIVTRGWPLNPRPGERVDHPHHVGLWFNYESVNGLDFWNNSDELKPEDAPKMGTILHRRIVTAIEGRRGDRARKLMNDHINRVERELDELCAAADRKEPTVSNRSTRV